MIFRKKLCVSNGMPNEFNTRLMMLFLNSKERFVLARVSKLWNQLSKESFGHENIELIMFQNFSSQPYFEFHDSDFTVNVEEIPPSRLSDVLSKTTKFYYDYYPPYPYFWEYIPLVSNFLPSSIHHIPDFGDSFPQKIRIDTLPIESHRESIGKLLQKCRILSVWNHPDKITLPGSSSVIAAEILSMKVDKNFLLRYPNLRALKIFMDIERWHSESVFIPESVRVLALSFRLISNWQVLSPVEYVSPVEDLPGVEVLIIDAGFCSPDVPIMKGCVEKALNIWVQKCVNLKRIVRKPDGWAKEVSSFDDESFGEFFVRRCLPTIHPGIGIETKFNHDTPIDGELMLTFS